MVSFPLSFADRRVASVVMRMPRETSTKGDKVAVNLRWPRSCANEIMRQKKRVKSRTAPWVQQQKRAAETRAARLERSPSMYSRLKCCPTAAV